MNFEVIEPPPSIGEPPALSRVRKFLRCRCRIREGLFV
jgi:hypothetical protein